MGIYSGKQLAFTFLILWICIIVGITGSGCLINGNDSEERVNTFTNLANQTAQEETAERMKQDGISPEQTDRLMSWIEEYNNIMSGAASLQGEYTEADTTELRPDFAALYSAWWEDRDYYDILCRHVAYELLRYNIRVDKPLAEKQWDIEPAVFDETGDEILVIDYGGWLQSDADIFREGHFLDWDEETIRKYYTLYNPVPVREESTQNDWAVTIQKTWSDYGISFQPSGPSLVTVWILDEQTDRLCIAHAGVLFENTSGFLFVEKTDPLYPYKASTYQNIEVFVSSLLLARETVHAEYGEEDVKMLIMRNNEEIGRT